MQNETYLNSEFKICKKIRNKTQKKKKNTE